MKDFKKNSRFSRDSRPSFGRGGFSRPSFGDRKERQFGGQNEMHPATCSKCGMACEVPFIPNGKKPIFCKNCFVRDERREDAPYESKPRFTPQHESRPARPVEDLRIGAMQREIAVMHEKIDTLVAHLISEEKAPVLRPKAAPKKAVSKKKIA